MAPDVALPRCTGLLLGWWHMAHEDEPSVDEIQSNLKWIKCEIAQVSLLRFITAPAVLTIDLTRYVCRTSLWKITKLYWKMLNEA